MEITGNNVNCMKKDFAMETNFISGKNAFKHLFYCLHYWQPLELDVLILHASGEEEVGKKIGKEIQEFWIRKQEEKDWKKSKIFPKLNIICLDTSFLYHSSLLRPLKKKYDKMNFFIAFALTNKMLCSPEILQRVYFLKEKTETSDFERLGSFRVFLSEKLTQENFLFHNDL